MHEQLASREGNVIELFSIGLTYDWVSFESANFKKEIKDSYEDALSHFHNKFFHPSARRRQPLLRNQKLKKWFEISHCFGCKTNYCNEPQCLANGSLHWEETKEETKKDSRCFVSTFMRKNYKKNKKKMSWKCRQIVLVVGHSHCAWQWLYKR